MQVDPYETPEGALSREMKEELNIKVSTALGLSFLAQKRRCADCTSGESYHQAHSMAGTFICTEASCGRATDPHEGRAQVDQQDLQPLIFGSHRHGDCHILMPLFCESPLMPVTDISTRSGDCRLTKSKPFPTTQESMLRGLTHAGGLCAALERLRAIVLHWPKRRAGEAWKGRQCVV